MLLYWIWYAMLPGLTGWQKCRLLEQFQNPEDLYQSGCSDSSLSQQTQKALEDKDLTKAQQIMHRCEEKGIRILTYGENAYPDRLRSIQSPPLVLYYRGLLPDFDSQPSIAVVGTRKASSYGLQAARRISGQIAACGGLVVTGGASGIDTMALHGALDAGGNTVVVLGSGVDVVYPRANRQLFEQVAQSGCLISEYPPGTPAYRWNFPERNRILSGLSNGTLVVEAPERSGALITAHDALEQGRDVFVVPGNIDVDSCVGSNRLLREGAIAVFGGYDAVREYEALYPGKIFRRDIACNADAYEKREEKVAQERVLPEKSRTHGEKYEKKAIDKGEDSPYSVLNKAFIGLSEQERAVAELLSARPQSVDDILAASDLPSGRVLSILTMLQIKGVVQYHPGSLVSLKNC